MRFSLATQWDRAPPAKRRARRFPVVASRWRGTLPVAAAADADNALTWRDANLRLEGPVIADLQRLFLRTWEKQRGPPLPARNWFPQLQPRGKHPARVVASSPDDAVPAIYVSLVSAIHNATRSVHITMAYFAPDPQTLEALKAAAARGVEVTLVLPSYTDFWGILYAGRLAHPRMGPILAIGRAGSGGRNSSREASPSRLEVLVVALP